jgi:hypothetical protein
MTLKSQRIISTQHLVKIHFNCSRYTTGTVGAMFSHRPSRKLYEERLEDRPMGLPEL